MSPGLSLSQVASPRSAGHSTKAPTTTTSTTSSSSTTTNYYCYYCCYYYLLLLSLLTTTAATTTKAPGSPQRCLPGGFWPSLPAGSTATVAVPSQLVVAIE